MPEKETGDVAPDDATEDKTSTEKNDSEDKTSDEDKNETKSLLEQKKHYREKYESAQRELDKLRADADKAEKDRLKKQEKYKELAEQQEAELKATQTKYESAVKRTAFLQAITKHKPLDVEAAYKLADIDKLTINEDGTVDGVDEAIESLVDNKAYLFDDGKGTVNKTTKPKGDATSGDDSGRKWRRSEIRELQETPDELAKHLPSIRKAIDNGNIIED